MLCLNTLSTVEEAESSTAMSRHWSVSLYGIFFDMPTYLPQLSVKPFFLISAICIKIFFKHFVASM